MENMAKYTDRNREELQQEFKSCSEAYEALKAGGMKLNIARGKPGRDQLNLVSGLLTVLKTPDDCIADGIDARNYGELSGMPCAKRYWAEILGCREEECFVGGNASLSLMYDTIAKAYTHGLLNSDVPWCKLEKVKFLCPAPGYDRHFRITESFGFELVTIRLTSSGPDMDAVEEAVKDPAVKGIWCVPKFSNPGGIVYSEETISRLAALKPAAKDFLLMWDNAYCIHEFAGDFEPFPDMIALCREAGNPNMVFEYASTSKVTFPGSGFCVMASSVDNIRYMQKLFGAQIISYDKLNQLRHVRFLQDKEHTLALMRKHAAILKPKFDTVIGTLEQEIGSLGIAAWEHPRGGYFVSVNTLPGLAKRTLELCKEAGVVMTNAGATYPYGIDPNDSNIRIAPTMPPVEELQEAMQIFCASLKLAALEQLLAE